MKYDGTLDIAVGYSAGTKNWKNKKFQWSEMVQRLSEEHKTNETYKEYIALNREEQGKIKDVGGYVGGYLRGGRRKPENVVHKQLLTLDIDFAHGEFWDDVQMQFNNAAVLHGSHKHHENSPRYRLVMPLSREVTPDEYVAISRKVAGMLNIDLFDNTTFEPNRLMFWPSTPKDIDYYFRFQDGPWIDADEILAMYVDWKDSSAWPTSTAQLDRIKTSSEKQEDPENKKGIIGAFCRTFSINQVIENFLNDVYTPANDGRYTYIKGTTAGGLIIYDDKFAFSHHGTDPCSGKLCNAFDLVRIHKYGHLDIDSKSGSKSESFKQMEDFARSNPEVRKIIASENLKDAKYDFADDYEDEEIDIYGDIDWMQELEIDARGKYLPTSININLIFANDIRLKGLFRHNKFDSKNYVFGNLPWRKVTEPEPIKNVDFSGIRNYIESIYGISGSLKIEDSLNLEFERNSFNPITDYLRKLEWDKTPRVDKLLVDYFGADDTIYTHEAMRKTLVGAVSRAMKPGCKFDMVLIIVGSQGAGKSTFIKKLGQKWFSDTMLTVQGKEALEQIQGAWIIEMAELSSLRKAEAEAIKHFISKQEDTFRPAYGKTIETFPRVCIFIGTSNRRDFLKDATGNRRFNPVDTDINKATKCVFNDLDQNEIDQIWAEAMYLYRIGETTYLSKDAERIAKTEQVNHSETDERIGIIEAFLDLELPEDWDEMDIYERRNYIDDPLSPSGTYQRDFVCVAEIWCECLGKNREDMDRYKTRDINEMLKSLPDWEQSKSTRNFKHYGKQKYYSRKLD